MYFKKYFKQFSSSHLKSILWILLCLWHVNVNVTHVVTLRYRYHSHAGSSRETRASRPWNRQHWPSGCPAKANCLPTNDAGVVCVTTVAVVDLTLLLAASTSPRIRSTPTNVTFTFIFLVVYSSFSSFPPTTVARGRRPPPGRKNALLEDCFFRRYLPRGWSESKDNRHWQSAARVLTRGGVLMLDGLNLVASRALHRAIPTAANTL